MLVVSQPPPLAFLVFLLSDWWEACATSAAVGGGAPGPGPQERGTGRGRLPPHTAALEVTRQEPWNDRRNARNVQVDLSQLFLIHSYQQKNGETPEALKVDPSITILLKD